MTNKRERAIDVDVDLVVVGAGLSGLVAAVDAETHGLSVAVLEARERSGGRIHSVDAAGTTIDLGAQWISDRQPRITRLARELGIAAHPTYRTGSDLHVEQGATRRTRGGSTPLGIVDQARLVRLLWPLGRLPRGDATRAALDNQTLLDFLTARSTSRHVLDHTIATLSGELCVDADRVSALEVAQQIASMGGWRGVADADQHIVTGGASQIVGGLTDRLAATVVHGAPVSHVRQHVDSVEVVTTQRTWRARHAIVAIPPQCITSIDFDPPLPDDRQAVLRRFVTGSVVKTVGVYERPWWRDRGLTGTISAPGEPFPTVVDSGPATSGRGILVALSTASASTRLRAIAPADRHELFRAHIHERVGDRTPDPVTVSSHDWTDETFSLGGYASRRGPGDGAVESLFAPFGRVHFAGSETADEWRSFMEGAIQAGSRASAAVVAAGRSSRSPGRRSAG